MIELRPDALVIGAQKAATTAIAANLNRVPGVFAPIKEFRAFGPEHEKRIDGYFHALGRAYGGDIPPRLVVEKSPDYMWDAEAVWRIKERLPDVKIIACVREPGDRAYSRYRDIKADQPKRYESRDFLTEVSKQIPKTGHLLRLGHYAEQLAPFLALFDNVHIIIQERLKANPEHEFRKLTRFLGLPDAPFKIETVHSSGKAEPMPSEARGLLDDYFAQHNERLRLLLNDPLEEWENPNGHVHSQQLA